MPFDRGRLPALLAREDEAFARARPRSRALFERAGSALLGGVPMPWMTMWPGGFPVYLAEARGAHWVKPKLVAEIAFAQFTSDGVVRHASFIGLRGDKPAEAVVEEKVQKVPDSDPGDAVKISNPDRVIFLADGRPAGELSDPTPETVAARMTHLEVTA